MNNNDLVMLFCGFLAGLTVGWLFFRLFSSDKGLDSAELISRYVSKDAYEQLLHTYEILNSQHQQKEQIIRGQDSEIATLTSEKQFMEEKLAEQVNTLNDMEKRLQTQFENLANRLLEEKSQKFVRSNGQQMEQILQPLRDKIKVFEENIEKKYMDESRERHLLKNEIEQLRALNAQLSKDAENLVLALKGDNKAQGNWGEFRLELLLEKAGLTKDVHFQAQHVFADEQQQKKQPDFIINLPDKKHLVIDSKVSLTAYEKYFSESDTEQRKIHLKQHTDSIRNHIKNLHGKNYQQLYQINSPDYLLMFIPIEPAFTAALQEDQDLFTDALDKNIVLVTTSTLLATMRTVSFLWKQDKQKQNVMEIARQSGLLYDKFVDFVEDLKKVGLRLDSAKDAYGDAMNKLATAKRPGDTLIGKAERVRELGARNAKLLPKELTDLQEAEEEE